MTNSIAIHQPNYFPWLGYFLKIYASDIFVFHDDIPFSKQSYTKRCQIRKELNQSETQWMGVPVSFNDGQLISEVKIDHASLNINKQIEKLKYLYQNSPFFDDYFPLFKNLLESIESQSLLAEFNMMVIKEICKTLQIASKLSKSSSLNFEANKHEYNIQIINHFNGNLYYSGMGATKYQIEEDFSSNNIQLQYLDPSNYLSNNPYKQHQGDFILGLSIIDAFFNIGKEEIIILFEIMLNK